MPVFDNPRDLETWKATGAFPKIHDQIFNFCVAALHALPAGRNVLDVGCNHGLLTARLRQYWPVIGADMNKAAVERGRGAGIPDLFHVSSNDDTMRLIRSKRVNTLVCRRVLSEICLSMEDDPKALARWLHSSPVRTIVLQGRVPVKRPVVALFDTAREVDAVKAAGFELVELLGPCALLERK